MCDNITIPEVEHVLSGPRRSADCSPARGSAAGGNGGAQDQPEKKWCAWCGVWGDHTSGGCDDLHDVLLRRRAEEEKQPNNVLGRTKQD